MNPQPRSCIRSRSLPEDGDKRVVASFAVREQRLHRDTPVRVPPETDEKRPAAKPVDTAEGPVLWVGPRVASPPARGLHQGVQARTRSRRLLRSSAQDSELRVHDRLAEVVVQRLPYVSARHADVLWRQVAGLREGGPMGGCVRRRARPARTLRSVRARPRRGGGLHPWCLRLHLALSRGWLARYGDFDVDGPGKVFGHNPYKSGP